MSLETAIFSLSAPVAVEILKEVGTKLLGEAPAVIKTARGPRLQRPDKRLSMGVTKREGKDFVTLFVEKQDSWAMRKAKEVQEPLSDRIVVTLTGKAHSSWPRHPMKQHDPHKLRPGLSVSHFGGFAGTLGCLVRIRSKSKEWLSIAGASHVLAMNNSAQTGDAVLLPGFPDGPKARANQIGVITDFTFLVHHQDVDPHARSTNTEDIAVVKLDDQENCPPANLVPNPKDPDRKIKLKGCLSDEELVERMSEPVFKVGRTTTFTEGIFEGVMTNPHSIRLPDRKVYLYSSTLVVLNKGRKAFSQPGDSGSLVYTADGKGLGLIIGASDQVTYLSPLSSCLEAMNAEILT